MDDRKPDMPQFLKSLDSVVELFKGMSDTRDDYQQIDDALTKHIDMLEMLKTINIDIISFKHGTKMELESFHQTMKGLFGKNRFISKEAEILRKSCPDSSGKDLGVLQLLDGQIKNLVKLRRKLWVDDLVGEVIDEQIKVLRSLPKVFPKGAPIRSSIKKRIVALKK